MTTRQNTAREPFFPRDKEFYQTLVRLMSVVVLQNLVAYSVNMADNLMLGAYSQAALSGAATVNMVQFMVQQITMAIGDSVVVLGSQYWGQRRTGPVRRLAGIALTVGLVFGLGVFAWTSLAPRSLLTLFTDEEAYIAEGMAYLRLIRFTYPIYVVTTILMAALRSVEVVKIALRVSLLSLAVDVGINYTLIFGHFGAPELGINGAAVGTLTARILELLIVLWYVLRRDDRLQLFRENPFRFDKTLTGSYFRIFVPSFLSNFLWSIATPIQTGILGRLSADAIAANSVSTTVFQYLKVLTVGEASASAVQMGKIVGSGCEEKKIRAYSRTLQVIYVAIGLTLAAALYFVRIPFLRMYSLTPTALELADQIMRLLCIIMAGMAYQMPTGVGIIKGGGDVKFMLVTNVISTWGIVMPLSYLAAFVWRLPIVWVVALLNSDQVFKCLPTAIHCNRYRWIKRLTK